MIHVTMKWFKRVLISLLALVILIALLLIGVLFTNTGLNVTLWGAQKALPQLVVGESKGALFPRFSLYQVSFKDETFFIDTTLNELTLAINPHCFLTPSVCIDEIKIDGLDFTLSALPESEEAPEPQPTEPVTDIELPIPVQVNNLALSDISLDILGNEVDWQSFTTDLKMSGRTLTIYPTQLSNINLKLAESDPSTDNEEPEPMASSSPPEPITLPEVLIPLEIDLNKFELKNFKLQSSTPFTLNRLELVAHADKHDVEIEHLFLDVPQVDLSLTTDVTLRGGYPINLHAEAKVKETEVKGQKIELSLNGSVDDLSLQAKFSDLIKASLEGHIEPLEPSLPFDLALSQGYVQWPFTGEAEYVVDVEALQVTGSLEGYHLGLDTKVSGKPIPELDLALKGQGNLEQVELENIKLKTLGGVVSGQVMANWNAPINWSATLGLSDIQPGLQWEAAEGIISGSLSTSGELLESGGWHVKLPSLDIEGVVREYPLNIDGNVEAFDKEGKGELQLVTEGLNLSHGPNGLSLTGNVNKELNLATKLDFPDIEKSVPDLKGAIKGTIHLKGKIETPVIETDLTATGIEYQDLAKVSSVNLEGEIAPLPVPEGQISLTVEKVEAQGQVVDSIDLTFAGSQKKHGLNISMLSELLQLSVHVSGGLEEAPEMKWVGSLDKADFATEQGPWRIDHPVDLSFLLDKQIAKVQAHCWNQALSSVCLTKDMTAGKSGEAELAVKNFSFEQIAMFLPENLQIEGNVNVSSWASWSPDKSPEADIQIQLPTGKVIQSGDQTLELGWDEIALNAKLHNEQLKADWMLDLTDNGVIRGDANVADIRDKEQELDASLQIEQLTTEMIQPLLGEYSQLDAQIDSKLHLSGPVMHPAINGELSIHDIVVLGEITPLEVKNGKILLSFSGYEALLNADIESSDGVLEIDGDANWEKLDDWSTNVKVHSDELNVDLPPMVKVKVKPQMQILVSPKLAKIEGDIYLPWGRILVEELPPSAVSVSSDQIILDEDLQPVEKDAPLPMVLESDVNIHIGDDFRLSAFGLKGALIGKLNVTQKDKGPFIVGEINVKDGTYTSFGQDLIISKGTILMNGPADQPYIQITAIRNPDNTQDDVTAGIKVTGPASEPSIEIYSDPSMPQQNALSYLLRGQDIDGESGGDAMTTALIGLSLARSGRVVGEIGEAFGVSDLQLDTAGSGDDSQVTVSGYILPGLQVKYGVGIFDSFGEFTVRYRLMQDLYVEGVSGLDSAVDLLYQFDFD